MDKHEQERVDKQTDRFTKEIWELKQKVGKLENYIKFKSLWDDFEIVSGSLRFYIYHWGEQEKAEKGEQTNKCENGTKIPEGGCFGCEEGRLCE